MIIEKYRKDFCIFVFMETIDRSTEAKANLVDLGYDVYLFQDQDTLLNRVFESKPHIVVFEPEALVSPLSEFVEKILQSSPDTSFVTVTNKETSKALLEYRDYNFSRYINNSDGYLSDLAWELDGLCEKKLLEYQNLDLLSANKNLEAKAEDLQKKLASSSLKLQEHEDFSAEKYISHFSKAKSREELIDLFLGSLRDIEHKRGQKIFAVYFKFLPTVQSLLATSSFGIDNENLKGVGGKIEPNELEQLDENLSQNILPKSIERVLHEGLFAQSYQVKQVRVGRIFDGIFVFWSNAPISFSILANEFAVFNQQYLILQQNIKLEKVDILDPVTELYNQAQYLPRLEEELARARRLQKPVSVARLSIDNYGELAESFGPHQIDVILKSIAIMIKKSSRVNDLSFRLEGNQFALLLPHCSRKGAALKAERLRRVIESHAFTTNGFKLTVSFGVSEYPSLCTKAVELDNTSRQAVEHIQAKGGNKVCLFKPPESFNPDFVVDAD